MRCVTALVPATKSFHLSVLSDSVRAGEDSVEASCGEGVRGGPWNLSSPQGSGPIATFPLPVPLDPAVGPAPLLSSRDYFLVLEVGARPPLLKPIVPISELHVEALVS